MKKIMIAAWITPEDKYENYVHALKQLGAEPFISLDIGDLDSADGLLLPGSFQDMNPKLWGAEDICSNDINDELDAIQWMLLEKAVERHIPVLGICRGMQFINVYFGGTLIQDLPEAEMHKAREPESYHPVFIADGTELYDLFGKIAETNTRHHQGVGRLGKDLQVSAMWIADDGMVVEAIQHKELPILGVQWHPERMALYGNAQQQKDGEKLLKHWLNMK